jgi:hypothetical protein
MSSYYNGSTGEKPVKFKPLALALIGLVILALSLASCGSQSAAAKPNATADTGEKMSMPASTEAMAMPMPESTEAMAMPSMTESPNGMKMSAMEMPADLDTASSRLSGLGLYQVSFKSSQPVDAINEIFSWTLHIETPDGKPVERADISIRTLMPQHGHGMPTNPQITKELGGGDYMLDGLKYSMSGWWEIKLTITADQKTDVVTFNQVLK